MKSPVDYVKEWVGGKIVGGLEGLVIDYITALPILLGISVGVYALLNMISSKLATLGVIGVFVYGALVIIA